ncbi:hypothetical protein ACP6L2_01235 [Sphingobacterium lactis]|uniref:hypothetical protein n=1 Tax=Sphingobacterium lactis TaxID=797291 RepID=UPI003F823B9B
MAQTIIKELSSEKKLKTYIDETKARFAPIFWPSLSRKETTDNLRWDILIGERKSGVAGNVTAFDVSAPLHSRDALREKGGKIPSIRGKRVMKETDFRKYINLRKQGRATSELLDLVYDDVSFCSIAGHKRVDWMEAKLLSDAGRVSFTDTNNVGAVTQFNVDFNIPNKYGVSVVWSDTEGSDPLKDLKQTIILPLAEKGITGGIIRMHPAKIFQLLESKKVLAKFGLLTKGQVDGIDFDLSKLNAYMAANNFPTIRAFNASIGNEQDGKVVYSNPWNVDNITWTPEGQLFTVFDAGSVEDEVKIDGLIYSNYMGNLVKKWSEPDPAREFTAYEFNAFPALDVADEMITVNTNKVGSFE